MARAWIDRLAALMQRQPESRDRLGSWRQGTRLAAVVTLLAASVLTVASMVAGERRSLEGAAGQLPVATSAWRLYVEQPGDEPGCPEFRCLADAAAPLWAKAVPADGERRVELPRGARVWLALTVPPETLQQAGALAATHLAVGFLYGHHDVYVDGRPTAARPREPRRNPLVLDLSPDRLAEARPLTVVVHLFHDFGAFYPYSLAPGFVASGFVDDQALTSATTLHEWTGRIFHWSMGAVYLFLGVVFGILWLLDERYRESSVICAYTLSFALFHFLDVQRAVLSLPFSTWNYVSVVLTFYEGLLAAYLGLAFARARSELFVYGLPVGFLLPLAVLPLLPDSDTAFVLSRWLSGAFVPAGYLAGALACLLQARPLARRTEALPELAPRVRSLRLYAGGIAVLALLYCVESGVGDRLADYDGFRLYRIFHHAAMVVVISYLYYLTIQDYSIRAKIADRTHLSRFHRAAERGRAMDVVVVGVDLKRSERILALEDWVRGCMNRMRTEVVRAGGAVVSVEGDGLLALVERTGAPGEDQALLALVRQVHEAVEQLTEVLAGDGLLPPGSDPLRYRMALAPGRVRPVFDLVDGREHPGWAADDQPSPFLLTARLLGADKLIDPDRLRSNVLVSEELAARLGPALAGDGLAWAATPQTVEVKHGVVYRFSLLCLGGRKRTTKERLAVGQ